MNYKELKNDLIDKTYKTKYFNHKLFQKDRTAYWRRSFDDLFKYYRRFGVTEKMLIKALVECNFCGKVCYHLKKVVFYRYNDLLPDPKSFEVPYSNGYISYNSTENTKYTYDYLKKLLI